MSHEHAGDAVPRRLTNPAAPPAESDLAEWLGPAAHAFWRRLEQHISDSYPSVFAREWLFGGRKHGWSMRYKKSRSFCTFVPERLDFKLSIVFGAKERDLVEANSGGLSGETLDRYRAAATYHDGKWLLLSIDCEPAYRDAVRLLALKRRPAPSLESEPSR